MTQGRSQVIHLRLVVAGALDTWEPLDGHALVTCKIRVSSGAYDAWEPRTYEFLRTQDGWTINTPPASHHGYLRRERWQDVVDWFCRMQPVEIELLTTV